MVDASRLEEGDVIADRGLVHRIRRVTSEVTVVAGDPREVYFYAPNDQVFAFVVIQ